MPKPYEVSEGAEVTVINLTRLLSSAGPLERKMARSVSFCIIF